MEWRKSSSEKDTKVSPEVKDMSFQIRKTQQVPNSMNEKRTTAANFISKLKEVGGGRRDLFFP